jgi:hypothetical protein
MGWWLSPSVLAMHCTALSLSLHAQAVQQLDALHSAAADELERLYEARLALESEKAVHALAAMQARARRRSRLPTAHALAIGAACMQGSGGASAGCRGGRCRRAGHKCDRPSASP